MVIEEEFEIEGRKLIRRKSDSGFYIRSEQTGAEYDIAVDPIEFREERTYVETDRKIPERPEPASKPKDAVMMAAPPAEQKSASKKKRRAQKASEAKPVIEESEAK